MTPPLETLTTILTTTLTTYLENKFIFSLLILLGSIVVAKLLLLVINQVLERIARKTKTNVDDFIFQKTKRPLFYLVIFYGLKLAAAALSLDGVVVKLLHTLLAVVFVLILSRLLDAIIETWGADFARKTKTNLDEVLLPLFHKATKVFFVLVAFMWILRIWDVNITPYLAGVGISGLVLGLALQDSLKNIFGGISLILDKNFNLGDVIRLESGEIGTITEIGLRSTKMLTLDHELIFIPNGQLANMRISNYHRPTMKIRKTVAFQVEYGTNPEKVKKVVISSLGKVKDIHAKPSPSVMFEEMGDSGLKFQARFWVNWPQSYEATAAATEAIYYALQQAKIGIPYPTQTVYLKKEK